MPVGQHLGELKLFFLSAHTTGIHTGWIKPLWATALAVLMHNFLPSWSSGNLYVARLGTDWGVMNAARHYLIWVAVSAFCSNSTLSALRQWAISISPSLTFHYSCQCSKWITLHLKKQLSQLPVGFPNACESVGQVYKERCELTWFMATSTLSTWCMATVLILLKYSC